VRKIKVGVVPAAGKGRRLSDLLLTKVLPKPMLPILNKPILEYVIENMKKLGVEQVYLIVGFKKEIIQEYFGHGEDIGVEIEYVEQPTPQGIAQAIGLTRDYINQPFAVILGDDLTITESLDNLVRDFWSKRAKVVEGVVFERNAERLKLTCSVVLGENGNVLDIVEKPNSPPSNIRGAGIYIFDPLVYDYIKKTPIQPPRGEKEITNTIRLMAKDNLAYGSFINGVNINLNTMDSLLEAMRILMKAGSSR
jgi:dTDP-glucose pyrophosphorylase